MKKISRILSFTLACGLICFIGCKKSEPPSEQTQPAATAKGQPSASPSAEKNSFQEVTSHLDPGGNLYLYFSTEQILEGLSGKVSNLRQLLAALPDVKDADRENLDKILNIVTNLIKTSGVEDVSGFGMSSIAREKGFYHTKAMLHHYQGKGSGFLWSLFGQKPHALDGLELLSTNTAFATFCNLDIPLLWNVIEKQVSQSGFPEAEQGLLKLRQAFEQTTSLKWDQMLGSLGGEYGVVLTLNDSKKISIPIPGGQPLEIPDPALMLVAKVNDDTIFNRVDEALKSSGQSVFRTDEADLKMRTVALPLPLPIQLGPTIATSHGYLFIGSTDLIIKEALAVKTGKTPGLKSTGEFQRLAKDVPQEGNNFVFLSERFGRTVREIQEQALSKAMHGSENQKELLSLFGSDHAGYLYSVGGNTPEGWLSIANGNQHPSKLILASSIVPAAVTAAMVLPALAKAKQRAQTINCINNLRQIDVAKKAWAVDEKKADNDTPTISDLLPHLAGNKFPKCPAGGEYTINSVSSAPECSIPRHVLQK